MNHTHSTASRLTAVFVTAFLMVAATLVPSFATGQDSSLAKEVITSMSPVVEEYLRQAKLANADETEVPVLMFHHITEEEGVSLRSDTFRRFMTELKAAGYTTVFYDELIDYVEGNGTLPYKPVVVSFDDGYMSNYDYAFPILQELGMKAEISVIGKTVGLSHNPATGIPIIPHFTWDQAVEMYESGLVMIRSHSYDLHSHDSSEHVDRLGALRKEGESLEEYDAAITSDNEKMASLISRHLGYENTVFTYPYGSYSTRTERLLSDPIKVTVTTNIGTNYVKKGDPSSLRLLNRIPCDTNSSMNIVDIIESYLD